MNQYDRGRQAIDSRTSQTQPLKKIGQREITATVRSVSGIRVGGSDDLLQIGGTDLTVIKHPTTRRPYVPGSTLKGKLRSELEKKLGRYGGRDGNEPCGCAKEFCLVCRVFGPHKNPRSTLGPTRIIVRDMQLGDGGDIEIKSENVIDRVTGTAQHPRNVERVAAGATWNLRISLQVWNIDETCSHNGKKGSEALVAFVLEGLKAVQSTGLGAGVSKGYGEIVIEDLKVDGQPRPL